MIVRPLQESDFASYDALAASHGSLYCTRAWLALAGTKSEPVGLFDDGGELVGGFALYRERRCGLTIFRQAPYTPTSGPFLAVKARNSAAILDAWRKAMEAVADYLDGQGAALTMLAFDPFLTDMLPFRWRGYKVVPGYTYRLDLTLTADELHAAMSSGRRNDISKARRDGVVAQPVGDLTIVRDLVLASFARQNKWLRRERLDAVLFRFATPANSYAYAACRDGLPLAACFVVHDTRTAYYLLGGYRADNRHHGAGALAVQAAVEHARALGLQVFDFEGSMVPAIEKFFRGFGGRLTPYYTVNKAWLPIEMALKFVKRTAF